MIIQPSKITKLGIIFAAIVFGGLLVAFFDEPIWEWIIVGPIAVYLTIYFGSHLVTKLNIDDKKMRFRSLGIDETIEAREVERLEIFEVRSGNRYGPMYTKKLLVWLKNGRKIIFPFSHVFDKTNIEMNQITEHFFGKKPKKIGTLGYKEGVKQFGWKFLVFDAFTVK